MDGLRFPRPVVIVGASVVLTSALAGQPTAQPAAPRFERSACTFRVPGNYPQDLDRECGYLTVPEVRGRPSSRFFRLAVVRYPAKDPGGAPPLLILHGGPGGRGGIRFPWGEMRFPLVRRRDVVIFDMRGVGLSEPRLCPDFEREAAPAFDRPTRAEQEQGYRDAVKACVTRLDAQGFDRSAYGADVSAADAIDLRRALGVAKWDVYGASYGGSVVQELLRRDSGGIRAAVLASAITPGPDYSIYSLGYQRLLDRVFASCAAQPTCRAAFPTIEEDFYAVYEELSKTPVVVRVEGTSPPRTVVMTGDQFVMRFRTQFGPRLSQLPLLISELRRSDRDAVLRQLLATPRNGPWDALSHLVGCNEYGAAYPEAVAAAKPQLRPAFQGIVEDFREQCDLWLPRPSHQIDRTPIASDVPTLVVHGEWDPMDVEGIQRTITARLTRAYTFVFPGEGHAAPPVGCHADIVQQFLENPSRAPDASCLTRMPRIQFRTIGLAPR